MPLFIDRLPLDSWTDQTQNPPVTHWAIVLPVLVTDPGLAAPPAGLPVQRWCMDPGHDGEAFAWRHHLLAAGLDPARGRAVGRMSLTSAVGGRISAPIRQADLWLVSNLPIVHASFYRIGLHRGIPFNDVPSLPDPHFNRPLIGMRALRHARLRVEVNFDNDTVSVWTPDPAPPP